ncbi:MAG: glycosyltransferase family 4 protein [Bacteroidia bacterium]
MACIRALLSHENVEVMLVRWQVNQEAPFQFQFPESLKLLTKGEVSMDEIEKRCLDFQPNIVYIVGWMDKAYLKIAQKLKKQNIPIVAGVDNPWKGTLKQKMTARLMGIYLSQYITHIWAAGIRQYEFARRLGFDRKNILLGLYSADVKNFQVENPNLPRKYAKTILHLGRFLDWKGVLELAQAFAEIQQTQPNDWQLLMVGRGPLQAVLPQHPKIQFKDFVQPQEAAELMKNVGCFVLASWEEHWGVSVHEAAAAACPLLVSEGVASGTAFVRDGYNGYVFRPNDKKSLKEALLKIMQSSDNQLIEMGERSVELSRQITPEIWASTILSTLS